MWRNKPGNRCTKKKIDLLNEMKQTIITDAVTKGLDSNATMKDSGVEWIGKIPEHWEVRRLKTLCKSIRNGYVGPTRDLYQEFGIPYIQSVHIRMETFCLKEKNIMFQMNGLKNTLKLKRVIY